MRTALKAEKVLDESLWGKQSRLVWAGRYHDGNEMARILSDADTKSLPRPLVETVRPRHTGEVTMNEAQPKIYLVEYPSSLDDRNYIARISGGLQPNCAASASEIRNPAYSQEEGRAVE